MPLTVAFASDIHLEFMGDKVDNILKSKADVLCLCGDITAGGSAHDFAKFEIFLSEIERNYKYILHIAGNHEYYSVVQHKGDRVFTMREIDRRFKRLHEIFPNYNYLNCDTFDVIKNKKKYTFIGCSLWTYVTPKNRVKAEGIMNDYQNIYYNKKDKVVKYDIEEMQRLHKKHVTFIRKSLKAAQNTCILMVHHKPFLEYVSKTATDECYHTDLHQKIYKFDQVKTVIFGHTHQACNKVVEGIRYLSNPKGYPRQATKFKPSLAIKIA